MLLTLARCGGQGGPQQKMDNPEALEGSWRLIRTIEHGVDDTTNRRDGSQIAYHKHITSSHFMWIEFDLDQSRLLGAGGGTYSYDGSTYIEDISFFYPPGSNERGQKIKFKVDFGDGAWRHTGYVKVYDFDPESGNNLVSDSIIIDEIWEPIDAGHDNDLRLNGS